MGNTVLLAQPTAGIASMELPPSNDLLGDTLVIAFTGSDPRTLERGKWAIASKGKYLQAAKHRKMVCEAFADVHINESKCEEVFQEESVPEPVRRCVVEMPEVNEVKQHFPGLAGEDVQGRGGKDENEGEAEESGASAEETSEVEPQPVAEATIAVNHCVDEDPSSVLASLQAKVSMLQEEASTVLRNEAACKLEHEGQTFCSEDAGGRDVCREIMVDLQTTAVKMGREARLKVEAAITAAEHEHSVSAKGLAVPIGEPMSFYHPATWAACFPEFVYGDGVPNLDRRCGLTFEEIFQILLNRQELQYTVPGEAQAFVAPSSNRFASPEMVAIFADVRRRLALLSSARALVSRAGFTKDMQLIAQATSADFMEALNLCGPEGGVQEVLRNPKTSAALKTVLRNLSICTANIPGTDGRKMVQRHIGHSMNVIFGPCSLFVTFNFADTRSKIVHKLFTDAAKNPEELTIQLLEDNPAMPSLRDMHRLVAQNPRVQSKFFLFMLGLFVRHVLGIDDCWWGKHKIAKPVVPGKEDDACCSLRPCLLPFAIACMGPGESQERGFEHAHIKVHGLTAADGQRIRRLLQQPDADLDAALKYWRRTTIDYAKSLLQESATWTGKSLGLELAPIGFTTEQQRQTRFDGGNEEDGQQRPYLAVSEADVDGHMQREQALAWAEKRSCRGYMDVPLTGACNSQLPCYRLPGAFGGIADANSSLSRLPWEKTADGTAVVVSKATSKPATFEELREDALLFSKAFAEDVRKCFFFSQMHKCVESCVKYVKSRASKAQQVQKNRAPLCRAGFFHIVNIGQSVAGTGKRKRRRGKRLREEAEVDEDPSSKSFGRIQLPRDHPFLSVSSDVAQVLGRCNIDVQFLDLLAPSNVESSFAPGDVQGPRWLRALGVRTVSEQAMPVANILAYMYRAMHNCDFYITKYVAKPLQSMKSVIEQMKYAMLRMEEEVRQAGGIQGGAQVQPPDTQAAAIRTLLKIAHAANRCYWQSATELCTTLLTGGDMLQSHVVQTAAW